MTMTAQETAATIDIAESEVVVAGDWHANRLWIGRAIPAAARTGARTLLHVGDFGFWPGGSADLLATIEYWVARSWAQPTRSGIERVLVTPGNHEDWENLDQLFETNPGRAVRVSESVWVLPRGFRFTIGNRTFLSFGGAASIDAGHRVPGHSWWPSELPSPGEVEVAIAGGATEALLTHDVGHESTPLVTRILNGPSDWPLHARSYSDTSRALIGQVVTGTNPLLHLHGHYHVRDSASIEREGVPPWRVESLGMDGLDGNLVLLRLDDLSVTDVAVPR